MVGLLNVTKRFGSLVAVRGVTLTMEQPGVYGLLGTNGAGKTTTIRMLCGIIQPNEGERVFSREYVNRIGYMPEELAVYRDSSLEEHLRLLGKLRNIPAKTLFLNVVELVKALDLSSVVRRPVGYLSKGTARKVQYVCTVAHEPQLLVLDEPFSGLDPISAHIMEQDLRRRCAAGCTILLSTHQIEQAERFCNHVFMLHRGQKVIDSDLVNLLDDPLIQRYEVVTAKALEGTPIDFTLEGMERGRYRYSISVPRESAKQQEFFSVLGGCDVVSMRTVRVGLNEVFLNTVEDVKS